MPLYEFRCNKCDTVFEQLCRMGENGKKLECVKCGSRGARRIMSVCATRVKGESGHVSSGGSKCASCSSGSCATCH